MEVHVANILRHKENQFALAPGTLGPWLPVIMDAIDAIIQAILKALPVPPGPTPTPTPTPSPTPAP